MALVCLRSPLKQLAGGRSEHELRGDTVAAALRELERAHPALAGWVLDERGSIRRHINVFVNSERAGEHTAVGSADRIEVIPAISGGRAGRLEGACASARGRVVERNVEPERRAG